LAVSTAHSCAAKPTADCDARLGDGFIKADRFVQMMMDAVPK
jgi:hypothetical protein